MATVTILRLKSADPDILLRNLDRRLAEAPAMFQGMPVALDVDALDPLPDDAGLNTLIAGLRERGLAPVAVTGQHEDTLARATRLGLGVMRSGATTASEPPKSAPVAAAAAAAVPTRIVTQPVRSGQQVYADNRDLTVLATVGAGAEVIADGSIHIYGALRGRALAGAQGNPKARIFCREFHAELVAVAGHYKVLEDIPKDLHGKPVQVWLDGEALRIEQLD